MSDVQKINPTPATSDLRSSIPIQNRSEEVAALLGVLQTVRTERPPHKVGTAALHSLRTTDQSALADQHSRDAAFYNIPGITGADSTNIGSIPRILAFTMSTSLQRSWGRCSNLDIFPQPCRSLSVQ